MRDSPIRLFFRALRAVCASALLLAAGLAAGAGAAERVLRFEGGEGRARQLSLSELRESCGTRRVSVAHDPYYQTPKRFAAMALACVVGRGFGEALARDGHYFLRAADGYERPVGGAQLLEPGGFLAFADVDHAKGDDPGWQPIDRRQLDPGPFYVVWSGEEQNDPHRHPWPYQLVAVERASFAERHPHTVPRSAPPEAPAWRGYALFQGECSTCHAVNGEGGTVGPELNVPRSIVEYREIEQLKAFIRDPQSFRYTSMPPHPHLEEAELDALIDYFRVMARHKHDPRAEDSGGE